MTCRHLGIATCVQRAASFVGVQEIEVFAGKQNFFQYAVITCVAVQCTVFETASLQLADAQWVTLMRNTSKFSKCHIAEGGKVGQ